VTAPARRRRATAPRVRLPGGEVHVWRVPLALEAGKLDAMARLLSADEHERAARFRFPRDRDRFVAARGALRGLLGRYTGARPEQLRFRYDRYGKPAVEAPRSARLAFNVSHSADVALVAVARDGDVGVDVELASGAAAAVERVPERFFSAAEVAVLRALPERDQPAAFLRCWTRKEAYVKARGEGLSLPLDGFDVSFAPGEPPALLRTVWSEDEPRAWRLTDLSDPAGRYAAALAVRPARRVVARELHGGGPTFHPIPTEWS
jgi:4'-phosphopantetheinyl transferase